MIPSDNSTVLRPENYSLGFTQSEIGTWDDCPEKWYLGYNHMFRRRGEFKMYFVYGDAGHRTLSHWYRTGELEVASLQLPPDAILDANEEAEIDKWQQILQVQMERYTTYYQNDLDEMTVVMNEEIVSTEFEGIKFTGKIDLAYEVSGEQGLFMSDNKFVGRLDATATEGWEFRFQFMFYTWLVERYLGRPVDMFVANAVKKPALKQGATESVQAYCSRVRQDMIQRPLEYFRRTKLATMQNSMKHFEDRVLRPKLERIKLLTEGNTPDNIIESLVRNQNTNNCVKYGQRCQFLPVCQNGWANEQRGYVERANKHEELEAE